MFWGESREVRVFLWGSGAPPTRVTSTGSPRRVSLSLPLSFPPYYFSSAVASSAVASSLSLAERLSLCRMAPLWGRGGCRRLRYPSPLHLPLLSPYPFPPLLSLPPRPLAPRVCRACCGFSGVWPLCGSPPCIKFMIRATMARACSSGVPLPPNGGGDPTPTMVPPWISPPTPSTSLRLALGGGLLRSWGCPPISCIRPRTKGMRACSGGGPPYPLG